ncbi:MAG: hypothetical protein RL693_22 [Verrucomicrobiota bacterium]|jgi:hypothetical protein
MSADPQDTREWFRLFGAMSDGTITAGDHARLEEVLTQHREARRLWFLHNDVDAGLHAWTTAQQSKAPVDADLKRRAVSFKAFAALAAAACAILLALFLEKRQTASPASFVTLTAATNAQWSDPNVELSLRSGEMVKGPLKLESGKAEFLLIDGAIAVMEGPAVVRFAERKLIVVESGKLFCSCPTPQSRLSVKTPETEIVDLGTEFAVEARLDKSTRVAVLSGEVKVGNKQTRLLRKGEAVEIRGDGIMAIQPLPPDAFSELLMISPVVSEAVLHGENVLRDPGFANGLAADTWSGTEGYVAADSQGGRSGGVIRIDARGHRFWPQCRQKLATGDISGRLVIGSVYAMHPSSDALKESQSAMLKIVFTNAEGREFAFALRRFLNAGQPTDRYVQAQVAAFAPEGTKAVQFQLMLNARGLKTGSVYFDDASLIIAETAPK